MNFTEKDWHKLLNARTYKKYGRGREAKEINVWESEHDISPRR
jgi:hypothetical protein